MVNRYNGSYLFEINDWLPRNKDPDDIMPEESISSPEFQISGKGKWKMEVFRNGLSQETIGNVCVLVHLLSKPALKAKIRIFILTKAFPGHEVDSIAFMLPKPWNDDYTSSWMATNIILTNAAYSEEAGYCIDDSVAIGVDITVFGDLKGYDDFEQTESPCLANDFRAILQSKSLSDVSIISKDGFIARAHKCILYARSKAFAAQLNSSSFKLKSALFGKHLKFPYSKATLMQVLQYIYTDSIIM